MFGTVLVFTMYTYLQEHTYVVVTCFISSLFQGLIHSLGGLMYVDIDLHLIFWGIFGRKKELKEQLICGLLLPWRGIFLFFLAKLIWKSHIFSKERCDPGQKRVSTSSELGQEAEDQIVAATKNGATEREAM